MKFLNKVDKIVLFIGLSIISVSSTLLYLDLTKKQSASTEKIIGKITYKKKAAQRKYSSQVVWENIQKESSIRNYDSIKTSDLSEAIIKLNDGTILQLAENSMILLSLNEKNIDIDFSKGSISTKTTSQDNLKSINIKSGNTTVKLKNSNATLLNDNKNKLNLSLEKGNAIILADGKETIVDKNVTTTINTNTNKIKSKRKVIILTKPKNQDMFLSKSKSKIIYFSWNKLKSKNKKIIISKDRLFKKIFTEKTIKKNQTKISLPEGSFYWKVLSNKKSSEIKRFSIVYEKPLFLISPNNFSEKTYREINPIITFKWSKSYTAKNYILKIAKDPKMKNIIKEKVLSINSYVTDDLTNNKYYWQITSNIQLKNTNYKIFSKINSFKIIKKRTIKPSLLYYPINNEKLNKIIIQKNGISFSWKKDLEVTNYKIEISKDYKFKNIVVSKRIDRNFIIIRNKSLFKNGTFFWRILCFQKGEKNIVKSKTNKFHIGTPKNIKLIQQHSLRNLVSSNIIYPKAYSEIDMSNKNSLYFSWEKNTEATSYEICLYKFRRKKRYLIFKKEVAGNSFNFYNLKKLDVGACSFTVQAIRAKNNKSNKSEVVTRFFKINLKSDSKEETTITPSIIYSDE